MNKSINIPTSANQKEIIEGIVKELSTDTLPINKIVEPLRCDEVRWFYRKISGERKWLPFRGYDSLRLEFVFRNPRFDQKVIVRGQLYEADVSTMMYYPLYWSGANKQTGNDIMPIYRATWFDDVNSYPLENSYAKDIEEHHLSLYQGHRVLTYQTSDTSSRGETSKKNEKKQSILNAPNAQRLQFADFFVTWLTPLEVYMYSEAVHFRFLRTLSNKLGMQTGARIRRGYPVLATLEDKDAIIDHMVFVVHGIGQLVARGSIARRCIELRDLEQKLKGKYLDLPENQQTRAEFFPVEWRSSCKLDQGVIQSITPRRLRNLRGLFNSTVLDVLYYTSPLYRLELTDGLVKGINETYMKFTLANPYFLRHGKISIIAHSLGSVIMYDILTNFNPIALYEEYLRMATLLGHQSNIHSIADEEEIMKKQNSLPITQQVSKIIEMRSQLKTEEELLLKYSKGKNGDVNSGLKEKREQGSVLKFSKIENLFCIGSPLAVFLSLRGVRPGNDITQNHILPKSVCGRMFNIYHSSDPIVYRLEPLILKHYASYLPVRIHKHDATHPEPYEQMKPILESTTSKKSQLSKSFHEGSLDMMQNESNNAKDGSDFDDISVDDDTNDLMNDLETSKIIENNNSRIKKKNYLSSLPTANIEMSNRMDISKLINNFKKSDDLTTNQSHNANTNPDFLPQLEKRIDFQVTESRYENQYLSMLTAHTGYWTNMDVVLFVLKNIYLKST
ncbi:hypothetical protein SNEBB_004811 [Seison nebaliae]|nr:hypothetical protein SNEBB_004811 [Seison nebaliae]